VTVAGRRIGVSGAPLVLGGGCFHIALGQAVVADAAMPKKGGVACA
jgi:hypothetical protein